MAVPFKVIERPGDECCFCQVDHGLSIIVFDSGESFSICDECLETLMRLLKYAEKEE